MFLLSPDIIEAHWMLAPLPQKGSKWWLAWLSPKNLTTMWGENRQLVQSKIIATDDANEKLQAKLDEKLGKGYHILGKYDSSRHSWIPNPGIKTPAYPPTAKPGAYSATISKFPWTTMETRKSGSCSRTCEVAFSALETHSAWNTTSTGPT